MNTTTTDSPTPESARAEMQTECSDWLRRLHADGADRDVAIMDLRRVLLRGLKGSLVASQYLRASQSEFLEDVTQEALLKILDSLDSFAGRSRFTTWALAIATRVGLSELRRHHYRDVSLDGFSSDSALDFEAPQASVVEDYEHRAVLEALRRAIETQLSDKQRIAVRAFLEGLPMAEIARRTRSNRNAVYKLVHDARRRLRKGLEASGISADDVMALLP